jgi:hypothetical protein
VLAGSKGMKALSDRRLMHWASAPVMGLFGSCWYMIKVPMMLKELLAQRVSISKMYLRCTTEH